MHLYIGNRMFSLTLAAVLTFVAGCASNNATSTGADFSTDVATADTKNTLTTDEVVTPVSYKPALSCRMRRVTGSHIARQQCFTKQEKEDLEQASKTLLRTGGSRGGAYRVPSQSDPRDN